MDAGESSISVSQKTYKETRLLSMWTMVEILVHRKTAVAVI